jgi:hypothetical protein
MGCRSRLGVGYLSLCYQSRYVAAGSAHQAHTASVCDFTTDHREPTTMQKNAPKMMGREERRALLEQRRAAVARQLHRLAVELTDLDRRLKQIERSDR